MTETGPASPPGAAAQHALSDLRRVPELLSRLAASSVAGARAGRIVAASGQGLARGFPCYKGSYRRTWFAAEPHWTYPSPTVTAGVIASPDIPSMRAAPVMEYCTDAMSSST